MSAERHADPVVVTSEVLMTALATLTARPPVPRLTLTPEEAAAAIGCSRDFFDEHIGPELRWIRRGRLKFVPLRELERWTDENAARTLG